MALWLQARRCAALFHTATGAGRLAAWQLSKAEAALEAGEHSTALVAARRSLAVTTTVPGEVAEAIALAGTAPCVDTRRSADPAVRALLDADDRHAGTLDACRLAEARRLYNPETCGDVLPLLILLRGRVRGADAAWLAQAEAACSPLPPSERCPRRTG